MRRIIYFLASLLIASTCLLSCGGNTTSKKEQPKQSGSGGTADVQPEKASTIKSYVWIDGSLSMKGYVDTSEDPTFNGIIAALGTRSGNNGIALFGTSLETYEKYDDFKKKLESRNIKWCQESNLTSMITQAAVKSSSSVIFIISDGIMSGSDKEIRNSVDRKYNILQREALAEVLKNAIKSNKPQIAINVSQYKSKFRGYYFCYDNHHGRDTYKNDKSRPFYIFTVGAKDNVNNVISELYDNSDIIKTDKSLTYGDKNMPYDLNITMANSKYYSKEGNNYSFRTTNMRKDGVEDITFNLNLSILPTYMKNLDYLKKNGHFQYKAIKQGDNAYRDIQIDECEYKDGKLTIKVNKNLLHKVSIRYVLDYADPTWVIQSSTDDDKLNYSDNTTFNFKYLMKGLSVLNTEGPINKVENTIINITN